MRRPCIEYDALCTNLHGSCELSCITTSSDSSSAIWRLFIEDASPAVTINENEAKWHKSSNLKYNKTQLIRAQKPKAENDVSYTSTGFPGECETGKKRAAKLMYLIQNVMHAFLCEQPALPGILRNASTFDLNQKVHACAVELSDKGLLVKLASGDKMSQEAKCHSKCLVSV